MDGRHAPIPILVVEVLSRSTRERDLGVKRRFYMRAGVAEYWLVDREDVVVIQVRSNGEQRFDTTLTWSPPGTSVTLNIEVPKIFADLRR